jgi:hypothetical protein
LPMYPELTEDQIAAVGKAVSAVTAVESLR